MVRVKRAEDPSFTKKASFKETVPQKVCGKYMDRKREEPAVARKPGLAGQRDPEVRQLHGDKGRAPRGSGGHCAPAGARGDEQGKGA